MRSFIRFPAAGFYGTFSALPATPPPAVTLIAGRLLRAAQGRPTHRRPSAEEDATVEGSYTGKNPRLFLSRCVPPRQGRMPSVRTSQQTMYRICRRFARILTSVSLGAVLIFVRGSCIAPQKICFLFFSKVEILPLVSWDFAYMCDTSKSTPFHYGSFIFSSPSYAIIGGFFFFVRGKSLYFIKTSLQSTISSPCWMLTFLCIFKRITWFRREQTAIPVVRTFKK